MSSPNLSRPREVFPRLDAVTLHAMSIERINRKETILPAAKAR